MEAVKWDCCGIIVFAGDLGKAVLLFIDLWYSSTFHRFL